MKKILWWALGVAVALNIDKIVLGPFAPVRCHDTFDGPFLITRLFAHNLFRYGLISQSPENVCGATIFCYPGIVTLPAVMLLPAYLSYLFLSIFLIFIAFLGMFLFLRDEFKVVEKASLIGALFFSSITICLSFGLAIAGMPLLFWCFERIFSKNYFFVKRLSAYLYMLIYFAGSNFGIIALPIFVFYFVYFLLISRIKKTKKNILTIILIWSLFLIMNLPLISELFSHMPASHRSFWQLPPGMSWLYAAKCFIGSLFDIRMQYFYTTTPTLLGLLIILIYIFSSSRQYRDKYFYFPIISVLVIELVSFFLFQSPLWYALSGRLGFLKSLQFDRFAFLLVMIFSILIGQSSNFLIRQKYPVNKKAWYLSLSAVFLYVVSGIIFRLFPFNYFERLSDIVRPVAELVIQLLSLGIFLLLIGIKVARNKKPPIFTALFTAFLFFSLANTLHSRVSFGTENFRHYFRSPQIEKIKAIERGNIEKFRVADISGADQSKLLNNGFRCADGYVNVYPMAYKEFWAKVIEPEIRKSKKSRDYFSDRTSRVYLFYDGPKDQPIEKITFNPDLLRLINVKYIFSSRKVLDCAGYGFIEVAAKTDAYVNAPLWKKYFSEKEFYVYQNKYFAQPVFLTDSFIAFNTKGQLLEELGKKDYFYLVGHTFMLEADAQNLPSAALNAKNAEIKGYDLTPDKIRVWLRNQYPVILNWTTNYNKNWLCEIDGKKTPIFKIYNAFMGIVVPANSHVIEFRYRNVYLNYAYLISFLGFICINIYVIKHLKGI